MKKECLMSFSVKFEIETDKVKRTGVAVVIAPDAESAGLYFHDFVKKDKEWKKYKVLITERPKAVVSSVNLKPINDGQNDAQKS
jgi:hypothetical protein